MSETPPEVPAVITHKLGPLPGWAWILIVAGAAWGVHLWRKNRTGGAVSAAGASGAVPVSDSGTASYAPAGNLPSSGASSGQVITTPGVISPSTNAQWASAASNFLIGTGNYQGSDVQNAFDAYLNGNQLSAQYQAIIDSAVHQFGVPPEGVLPVKAAPAPSPVPLKDKYTKFLSFNDDPTLYGVTANGQMVGVTFAEWAALGYPHYDKVNATSGVPNPQNNWLGRPPAPAPGRVQAQGHTYTVQAGDTALSIAQRFYGTADVTKLAGQDITPGHVITIP